LWFHVDFDIAKSVTNVNSPDVSVEVFNFCRIVLDEEDTI